MFVKYLNIVIQEFTLVSVVSFGIQSLCAGIVRKH